MTNADENTIRALSKIKKYPCKKCERWKIGNLIVCSYACSKWETWFREYWHDIREANGYTEAEEEE